MKYNRILPTLALAVILSLLMLAIPATPALAQTVQVYPAQGPATTTVTVTGAGFAASGTVIVTYDAEGKISKVEPDEKSPLGMICRLGELSREIVYSKDRLLDPMLRKGPKGAYDLERISWDEALSLTVLPKR